MTVLSALRRLTGRDRRDRLTGCFLAHSPDERGFAPERVARWLVPMPGDAVFIGFDLKGFRAINDGHGFENLPPAFAESLRLVGYNAVSNRTR